MLTVITPCRNQSEEAVIREHVQSVLPGVPHRCACGPEIFRNRNSCIASVPDGDILSWDADIRATPEHVHQVMLAGPDIVGGAYHSREGAYYAAAVIGGHVQLHETGLIQVFWVGAGFLYIRRAALTRMQKPYFRHEFVPGDQTSEDVGFCINAMRNKTNVYLDADCVVTHLI